MWKVLCGVCALLVLANCQSRHSPLILAGTAYLDGVAAADKKVSVVVGEDKGGNWPVTVASYEGMTDNMGHFELQGKLSKNWEQIPTNMLSVHAFLPNLRKAGGIEFSVTNNAYRIQLSKDSLFKKNCQLNFLFSRKRD